MGRRAHCRRWWVDWYRRTVLTNLVLAVHLVVSALLIGLVLLHSGKGGGLSDMFGGSVGATALGSAAAERNLDRITVVVALMFAFTTAGLAFLLD
jgi:preprotein translocase subunit SecG